jgi:hypothetical protein
MNYRNTILKMTLMILNVEKDPKTFLEAIFYRDVAF